MNDRIAIEGRDGAFGAYIARPAVFPAPAVVVLHEVFGVNADIRKTCDELAGEGFIAVAPDLFWRQEPGVDLGVTSEPDWQHGLRLYQAYGGGAGVGEVDNLHAPLLMHRGEEDEFISKAAQVQTKTALDDKPNAIVYSYPGQRHAFARH